MSSHTLTRMVARRRCKGFMLATAIFAGSSVPSSNRLFCCDAFLITTSFPTSPTKAARFASAAGTTTTAVTASAAAADADGDADSDADANACADADDASADTADAGRSVDASPDSSSGNSLDVENVVIIGR